MNIASRTLSAYFEQRTALLNLGKTNEMTLREPFKNLLQAVAQSRKWTLAAEDTLRVDRPGGGTATIRPDAVLHDENRLPRGYWEAKDEKDDLESEIAAKFARGYPKTNIIFEDGRRAVLVQDGSRVGGEFDMSSPDALARLLETFFTYEPPHFEQFEQAVGRFQQDIPALAGSLETILAEAHKSDKRFGEAFDNLLALARASLNPATRPEEVDRMLVQHLLSERLMRTVFNLTEFRERNAIAGEVEKVIKALVSRSFSRDEFLGKLDYFYRAIEGAAADLPGFKDRQAFINTVYERFFQSYDRKTADTAGIVYTPQPIVDFMCAAVEEVLHDHFGRTLVSPDVCLIDPCTGTGNYIVHLLRRIAARDPAALPDVYANRLFANEVQLLPYYVAALNIEHEYRDLTGQYDPFDGLCFVDTLDLTDKPGGQLGLWNEANTARIERQKKAAINVIIGNPPYNVGQANENDNNKNRKYPDLDARLRATYVRDSKASSKSKLNDAYVKFFRWATDRLGGRDGVVCYVTNNGFVDGIAFDGMRKHLRDDFTTLYHVDLSGNARTSGERRRQEGGNVFSDQIRVGVGITVAIRDSKEAAKRLFYYRVPDYRRSESKLNFLRDMVVQKGRQNALNTVPFAELTPDARATWLVSDKSSEFTGFIPLSTQEAKDANTGRNSVIFTLFSLGVVTSRDDVVYDFDETALKTRVEQFSEEYNGEVDRFKRIKIAATRPKDVDQIVRYQNVKWSETLKLNLLRGNYAEYSDAKVRAAHYRPFTRKYLFYDTILIERPREFRRIFPNALSEKENVVICLSGLGHDIFYTIVSNQIVDYKFSNASNGGTQTFPFYVYDEDGTNRRDNITDWALSQFRQHYADDSITKWDIFWYTYAVLHHPDYRSRYAGALKRDLPRIPMLGIGQTADGRNVFWQMAKAGKRLGDLHLKYETHTPYPLETVWQPGKPVSYRVEKMKLVAAGSDRAKRKSSTKTDESPSPGAVSVSEAAAGVGEGAYSVKVNDSLTLRGIPAEAISGYKLGSRSPLEWMIDQYQVKTDARSGITNDPNLYSDDDQYIIRLVGRMVAVSLETIALVNEIATIPLNETASTTS